MERETRSYERRHSKHHKEKHKKRAHKRHRSRTSPASESHEQSYVTLISNKPLVEYSDVSSEELSAPEAGEIESEASSVGAGRHAEERSRGARGRSMRSFGGDGTVSVTAVSVVPVPRHDEYPLPARKRCADVDFEPTPPDFELHDSHSRYKKKKDKRKKEKKKRKKKSKHRSRSASLESVSPDENVTVARVGVSTGASPDVGVRRYVTVPVSEWEKPSSPLQNGSCSPLSPSTPPLHRQHHHDLPYSPPPHHEPLTRRRQKSSTPHTPAPLPIYHETVTIDSDPEVEYERHRTRDYWPQQRVQSPILVISDDSWMAQCLENAAGGVVLPNQVFSNSLPPEPPHEDEHHVEE
ncbi:hypothetical protein EVAR_11093_1 [Eumeta japonica]|uniref:Uncharacterized protein n=1 Tax=Eumeta variegata TaxID=151549 RepID=A0A4C1U411_EUMVA|nr:hypothetical protein EVAR_11093_1 [Eumeta japonica]